MAIPSMKTWMDGEVVSPQDLNEQIRDVGNFLLSGAPRIRMAQKVYGSIVPHATWHPLGWDSMDYDNAGIWNPQVPDALTIVDSGVYLITAKVSFSGNSAGALRAMRIRTDAQGTFTDTRAQPTSFMSLTASTIVFLSAGEAVEVQVYQDTGTSMTMTAGGGDDHSNVSIFRLAG